MKRNFTLLLLSLLVTSAVSAQRIFTEDFNYAMGKLTNVSDTVWEHLSGNTNNIKVIDGNLTYPGYITSPADSSRKINLDSSSGSAEDVLARFDKQDSGTVYCSFLLSVLTNGNLVTNKSAQGEYFISFLPAADNTNPIAGVAVRKGSASGTFNLGIFPRVNTGVSIVWANADYNVMDTLLVTIGYEIIAGDSNNLASLWINPPTDSLQPNPDAQAVDIDAGDSLKISKLALWQRSARTPVCDVDAIKISTTWNDVVLPLRLLSFNVINSNGYASLQWQTCGEINVKEFEVQKSNDARSFAPIAYIPAKNAACATTYTYNDPKQLAGTAYYRIRMVDNDGKSTYSGIVSVDGKLPTKLSVFPNPVTDNFALSHPKAESGAVIKIVSLNGTVVASLPVTKDAVQTNINVSKLASGNYIVVFHNARDQQTIKITKQ